MLNFETLGRNVADIKEYLKQTKTTTCDTTLGVKFIWGESLKTQYAIFNDTLILKETFGNGREIFYYPAGKDVVGALKEIEDYCLKKNIAVNLYALTQSEIEFLKERYYGYKISFDRTWSDYIYTAEQFKTYKGKKLSGQRNHVNRFKKNYPNYVFRKIEETDLDRVIEFVKEHAKNKGESSLTESEEKRLLPHFIAHMFDMECFGGYLEVDGKMVGVSVGEKRGDTLIVHVEKALYEYSGAYPTLAQEFAKAFAVNEIEFINREDDSGDLGLRTSKTQYQPIELRHKYCFNVSTLFNAIKETDVIATKRLTLSSLKEKDKETYFKIYSDDVLNKWWGYDYNVDLGDNEPTPKYFFEFQKSLKISGEEFTFAIRLNDQMIGDIVLYQFDFFGSLKVGFRLLEEFRNNGYALEAVLGITDYVKNNLKAKTLYSMCYKVNLRSKNLIEKAGFSLYDSDFELLFYKKDLQ